MLPSHPKVNHAAVADSSHGDCRSLPRGQALMLRVFPPRARAPQVSKSYGLLTWLGGAHEDPDDVQCCAPRWGSETCSGRRLRDSILGDDYASVGAPEVVAVGMGWLGQYIFVVPSQRMAIVSLGASWGSSIQCSAARGDGYDDAYSATQIWRAMDNITTGVADIHGKDPAKPQAKPNAMSTASSSSSSPPLAHAAARPRVRTIHSTRTRACCTGLASSVWPYYAQWADSDAIDRDAHKKPQ